MSDADVIVVGAGHNGLICAAYLARAGIDTLLVESRDQVGGCASTVSDLGARFNICNCDHAMIRGMPVIDELDLAAHGLRYVEPEASSINVFHDGSEPWAFFHDVDRTLESIAATYPSQVDGYRRYLDDALPVARLVLDVAATAPPGAPRILGRVARRRAEGAARLLDWSRRSVADVLADYFDDWHLTMPPVSGGPTVWGARPEVPGTGLAALGYASRHLVQVGRPVGGSGALTDATLASFELAGGKARTGVRVDRLLVRDGHAEGVRLADGTELRARAVVAACDPQRVFVDWLDGVPPAARRTVGRWRDAPVHEGYESKVDGVLDARPTWRAGVIDERFAGLDRLGPTTMVHPSPDDLAEAHAMRERGEVHPRPTMLVNVPTVLDDEMRRGATHDVLSLEVLFTPYGLRGGWPGSSEPQRWLDVLAGFWEPGGLDGLRAWRAMTPDRYESDFEMHRGHTPAYAGSPLSTLVGRRRELTRYRTPIAGLYLSGAATFPGAGVFGAPGRNAAATVRRDLSGTVRSRVAGVRRTVLDRVASLAGGQG